MHTSVAWPVVLLHWGRLPDMLLRRLGDLVPGLCWVLLGLERRVVDIVQQPVHLLRVLRGRLWLWWLFGLNT